MRWIFLAIIAITVLIPTSTLADSITLEKGASDEFSFIAGGSEQASLTTTGDFSVKGNIIGSTPTASNHLTTKAYVDAASAGGGGGGINWSDCEFKNSCQGGTGGANASLNTTITCTAGKVLVDHTCSMTAGADATSYPKCYLSAVDSLYMSGHNNSNSSYRAQSCGSIKCCSTN